MAPNSLPQKALRVYQQEGGRELLRRVRLKLRERWATFITRRTISLSLASNYAKEREGINKKYDESVDIIICIHNALEDVKKCLKSIEECNDHHVYSRLLLIDDGSAQETASFVKTYANENCLRLIRNEEARGYTFAANQGLRASSADCVVLLNSDTIVTPGWLRNMLKPLRTDNRIGVVGPLSNTASWQSIPYVEENGDWKNNTIPDSLNLNTFADTLHYLMPRQYAEVGFINGFCMLIRRETINDIGIFDEDTFGRGYGEENDFCLRAYKNKWKLCVCMQAYVFHSQSKSYSDERRMKLSQHADQLLEAKHGRALKQQQLACTMTHPMLLFGRSASQSAEAFYIALEAIKNKFKNLRILFLLPAAHAGGGSNVVISEARALRQAGIDVWIANLPQNRQSFKASYPQLDIPCCYFNLENPSELAIQSKGFDALIATHNHSAHWIHALWKYNPKNDQRYGYYIQDYEPFFYPADSKGQQNARKSYQLDTPIKKFCKTQWTANTLRNEINVNCEPIGPSIDATQYAPGVQQSDLDSKQTKPVRIAAMIRTSCNRRQPHLTASVLERLHIKFRTEVEIISFGSNDAELLGAGIVPKQSFKNLGRLTPEAVAELMRKTDIFIDASTFQAMGLTAMEAMASGCVVIGPSEGGLPEITDRESGKPLAICVDTNSADTIFETCAELIHDANRREFLADRSLQVCHYHPLIAACRMLNVLFNDA